MARYFSEPPLAKCHSRSQPPLAIGREQSRDLPDDAKKARMVSASSATWLEYSGRTLGKTRSTSSRRGPCLIAREQVSRRVGPALRRPSSAGTFLLPSLRSRQPASESGRNPAQPRTAAAGFKSGRCQPRTAQASRELRVTSPSSSFSSSLSWVASFLSDDLTAGLSSSFAGRCLGPWAFAPLSASNDAISEMNAT
jgi:hypothetical protein